MEARYLRTAKTNSLDTKSQQLDNVATVSDTTVGNNLSLLEDFRGVAADLVGNLERRWGVIGLATTVVGQPDTISASLNRTESVFDGSDTLENNWELSVLAELVEKVPAEDGGSRVARNVSQVKVLSNEILARWWCRSEQRGDERQYQEHQWSRQKP